MINKDEMAEQNGIKILPKNIRQIGQLQEGQKIYMEDYAYTYLHQYAAQNKKEEQIAFLIGEQTIIEDEEVMLIHGAVKAHYLKKENGNIEISDETWVNLHETRKYYFDGDEILGWAYTQPGYGVLLTSFLTKQHNDWFNKDGNVLFILDPVEKEERFFESKSGELVSKAGFFIYYEKNLPMHEYMLDYKVSDEVRSEQKDDVAVIQFRAKEHEKKEVIDHRRFVNMLFALCGALAIMCILIGVGLINNLEEMNRLKKSVGAVMADYGVLRDGLSEEISGEISEQVKKGINDEIAEENVPMGNVTKPDETIAEANSNITPEKVQEKPEEVVEAVKVITPEPKPSPEAKPKIPKTYIIKAGDSLLGISSRFYATEDRVGEIQELNDIENPHKIYIGQEILLPQQ